MHRQSSTIVHKRALASLLGLVIAAGVCSLQSVRADDTQKGAAATDPKIEKTDAKTKAASVGKEKRVFITGSAIPQKVTRNGRIVTSGQPVEYIDQSDIQHSGGVSAGDVLRKTVILHP